jgi:hypothetical protein
MEGNILCGWIRCKKGALPEVVKNMLIKLTSVVDDNCPYVSFGTYLRILKQAETRKLYLIHPFGAAESKKLLAIENTIQIENFSAKSLLIKHN